MSRQSVNFWRGGSEDIEVIYFTNFLNAGWPSTEVWREEGRLYNFRGPWEEEEIKTPSIFYIPEIFPRIKVSGYIF